MRNYFSSRTGAGRWLSVWLIVALIGAQLPAAALADTTGSQDGQETIVSFEALEDDVADQTVPLGTERGELNLPKTLRATLRQGGESGGDDLILDEDEPYPDPGIATPGDGREEDVDNATPGNGSEDGKNTGGYHYYQDDIPVTWESRPEYDGNLPGAYVFTAAAADPALTGAGKPPQITVTVGDCMAALYGRGGKEVEVNDIDALAAAFNEDGVGDNPECTIICDTSSGNMGSLTLVNMTVNARLIIRGDGDVIFISGSFNTIASEGPGGFTLVDGTAKSITVTGGSSRLESGTADSITVTGGTFRLKNGTVKNAVLEDGEIVVQGSSVVGDVLMTGGTIRTGSGGDSLRIDGEFICRGGVLRGVYEGDPFQPSHESEGSLVNESENEILASMRGSTFTLRPGNKLLMKTEKILIWLTWEAPDGIGGSYQGHNFSEGIWIENYAESEIEVLSAGPHTVVCSITDRDGNEVSNTVKKQDGKTFVSFDMPGRPATAKLTIYHADDVAAVNRMIEENNLTGFTKDDPEGWSRIPADPKNQTLGYAIGWNNENPRRIERLALINRDLTGTLDVSRFVNLTYLNCSSNRLDRLTGLDKLPQPQGIVSVVCHDNPFSEFTDINGNTLLVRQSRGGTVGMSSYSFETGQVIMTASPSNAGGNGNASYEPKGWRSLPEGKIDSMSFNQVTFHLDRDMEIISVWSPGIEAELLELSVAEAALSPAFDPAQMEYTAAVDYEVSKATVTARSLDSEAVVTGIGSHELKVGENVIAVSIVSGDGLERKDYTIRITRAQSAGEPEPEPEPQPVPQPTHSGDSSDGGSVPADPYLLHGTWERTEAGIWMFALETGGYAKNRWGLTLDGLWYRFDAEGRMLTGWQWIENQWYYLSTAAYAAANPGGSAAPYGTGDSGAADSNVADSNVANSDGVANPNGSGVSGTPRLKEGSMVTGWFRDPDTGFWYWLDESGAMAVGWQGIAGKWYYFNPESDGTKGKLMEDAAKSEE